VTAGASTPSQLTREVIRFLEQYQPEAEIAPEESLR
jgi:4-hydroxy-3-methylbut-2-enyl diphosphate reductase